MPSSGRVRLLSVSRHLRRQPRKSTIRAGTTRCHIERSMPRGGRHSHVAERIECRPQDEGSHRGAEPFGEAPASAQAEPRALPEPVRSRRHAPTPTRSPHAPTPTRRYVPLRPLPGFGRRRGQLFCFRDSGIHIAGRAQGRLNKDIDHVGDADKSQDPTQRFALQIVTLHA